MQIREAAQHLGVSTRALRHYEASGLLRPTRFENGYRNLSEADVRRAEWVRDLIAAGFSTRELRALITALDEGQAEPTCVGVLRDKLDQIDRLVEVLERRRRAVAERLVAQESIARQSAPLTAGTGEKPHREDSQHSGPALPSARSLR
jgi:MerR family transcriptional regulator, copper efflux regulator